MKNLFKTMLVGAILLSCAAAQAENVPMSKVRMSAAHYLQHNTSFTDIQPSQLKLALQWDNELTGEASMYLFTTPGEGWIIMTAETAMDPVVAYSDDSYFDTEHMPESLRWWLDGYNKMVCSMQNYAADNRVEDHPDWQLLLDKKLTGNTKASQVILMNEKWDQGDTKGRDYNLYSPVINDTVCPAGCVATAMSQLMHYFKYPVKPKGSVSYTVQANGQKITMSFADSAAFDYSLMPDKVNVYSTPMDQRREVSRLHAYAGAAVKMQYGPSGSGAHSHDVPSAMNTKFKYKMGTLTYRAYTSDSVYLSRIRTHLMEGIPLYMSGVSSSGSGRDAGGHAWICAGYRESNAKMYYMNWGWGGSSNGFYNLGDNDMLTSTGYNFNQAQAVIFNMVPPADSIVGIDEVETQVQLGKAYPSPATYSINLPYSTRSAVDLVVYSVDGRKVKSVRVQPGEGEVSLRVDAMPAGVYIYRMGDGYGKFVVSR